MIMNMRCASLVGKIVSGSFLEATAAEMFEAATINATRVLGRDDLGRLAPGAKADIAIVDLSGRGTLRYGPVRDPIKSLVDVGVGDDVDTVIVDGITRVEGGRSTASTWRKSTGSARRTPSGCGADGATGTSPNEPPRKRARGRSRSPADRSGRLPYRPAPSSRLSARLAASAARASGNTVRIIGFAVPSANSPVICDAGPAEEHLHEHADAGRGAGEVLVDGDGARLRARQARAPGSG